MSWRRSLGLLLLLVLGAAPAQAAITFDAASNTTGSVTASLTWSHTVSGADRVLVVAVGWFANTLGSVSSVTYNGAGLTQQGGVTHSSGLERVELWLLIAPATGTHDVVVTMNAAKEILLGGAASFTGVHQTTPTGTLASAQGSTTTPTVDVAAATGELVIDGVHAFRAGLTSMAAGAGQTQRTQAATGDDRLGLSTEAGAATVTMAWTLTGGSGDPSWQIAAMPLKPASAPAAAAPQRTLLGVGQ